MQRILRRKKLQMELEIVIGDELLESIHKVSRQHLPKEFGGLLIGNYSLDSKVAYINSTLLPKKYKSSKFYFERGIKGIEEKLKRLFYESEPSQIYLGEWHTHPYSSPNFSTTDFKAMQDIAKHKNVNILNPIMLIVGVFNDRFEYNFYLWDKDKLIKYE